jgi:hypothetical protein
MIAHGGGAKIVNFTIPYYESPVLRSKTTAPRPGRHAHAGKKIGVQRGNRDQQAAEDLSEE